MGKNQTKPTPTKKGTSEGAFSIKTSKFTLFSFTVFLALWVRLTHKINFIQNKRWCILTLYLELAHSMLIASPNYLKMLFLKLVTRPFLPHRAKHKVSGNITCTQIPVTRYWNDGLFKNPASDTQVDIPVQLKIFYVLNSI